MSWSLLSYHHHGNCWLLCNKVSAPGSILIQDSTGNSTPICCIGPQEGLEVVGIVQALTGNAVPSLNALQTKANSWLEAIKSNFLPWHLLWMALHHVIWPSLQYPLSITSFSPAQASLITLHLFQTLLPRLGVNWHFPMALCHASSQFLGLGIPHPFWEQGITKLQLFLELASAGNMEAKLIWTSLELLQLKLGSASNLFNLPYERWHSLGTDCWLKSLWQFIDFAAIQLSPALLIIPPPPHLRDMAIMDCILLSSLPSSSILAINHCWIAHRAFFWSDIVTRHGDTISPQFLQPPSLAQSSSWIWLPESPLHPDWACQTTSEMSIVASYLLFVNWNYKLYLLSSSTLNSLEHLIASLLFCMFSGILVLSIL